jgi:hypothetical protein
VAIRVTAFSPDFFVSTPATLPAFLSIPRRDVPLAISETISSKSDRFLAFPAKEESHRNDVVKVDNPPAVLKRWKQIAKFLGEPISVVQRWAAEGMPAVRQARFVSSSPAELNAWLGESGKPIHVVTPQSDLSAELKRGLAFVRQGKARREPASAQSKQARRKVSCPGRHCVYPFTRPIK